ncbi:hypothetical protein AMATHDRAFT_69546 [Amanita thiersii Skay4041]|uniref:DUF1479-domain-containing protein n=1 Tax=Amanita thiersii Skay4041 TaxID=703135 RepID=A0A2A9NFT5_9AGAR|nr:hypothetical protein AMATHDRAFT_69546 [Amanita thiersii Skay4041]
MANGPPIQGRRAPREEGSISAIFTSLTGEEAPVLPDRFADLKKSLWKDNFVESWRQVLIEAERMVEQIAERGNTMIPRVSFEELKNGLAADQISAIKEVGTVVVKDGIPREEALAWKAAIREYAARNKDQVKGFPEDNIQVFELYNSKSQISARTHPIAMQTQKALLSLWHKTDPLSDIDLTIPLSYFDRLRIRQPGDNKFTLGPHTDIGSVELWEDPGLRICFSSILQGGSAWKLHDPFDASPRVSPRQVSYNVSNKCSIFRCWQGWTSMSSTGPNEGTLKVFPNVKLSTAYMILRPFFRPKPGCAGSLKFDDWEPDLDTPTFPGSAIGNTQELNEKTHPHLDLARTMISIPRVEPGDQVFWHCDVIHAVESQHKGTTDSSVLYIPAVPLTLNNASYLHDQRLNFEAGLPAPDFPGGKGESQCIGRAIADDVKSAEARRMFGFEPLVVSPTGGNASFVQKANQLLGL